METFPLLSAVIFLPLIGAMFIGFFMRQKGADDDVAIENIKRVSLWITGATFVLSLLLWIDFEAGTAAFQFRESHAWPLASGIGYEVGLDGISLFFVLLTTFLMPLCILASWTSVKTRVREYMVAFLMLETLIIGVFSAMDFVLFYFFFEASLIPMYLIIGIWGGENRVYAAFKFFLYTLAGSVLLLLAMLYIINEANTAFIPELMQTLPSMPLDVQKWLWLAFFVSFAVKVPMWPVHTWLPDAHVQAPTAGSMVLAGVLLKMGGYAFLRFSLPMLPDATHYYADFVFALSVVAVVYTSLVALVQKDMKKLIAYSSVAHMGFVTAGCFALNIHGIDGSIFQMISHGVVSAALFFGVGVLYERAHTKEIAYYGGVVERMPKFALYFMFFTLASVGLPATSGFVGEFLVMLGVFEANKLAAAGIATGLILGAAYMLWLYRRVVFGPLVNEKLKEVLVDLNGKEKFVFLVLAIVTLVIGVYPSVILDVLEPSVLQLVQQVSQ